MAARLLDGTAVAQTIRQELTADVAAFTARAGRPPGLALVLVGDDPASHLYVNSKLKSAGDSGLRADIVAVPAEGAQTVADALIAAGVKGILNFAPVRLDVHDRVSVVSVDFLLSLEQLAFQVSPAATRRGLSPERWISTAPRVTSTRTSSFERVTLKSVPTTRTS